MLAHRRDPVPPIGGVCIDGDQLQPLLNRMMAKKVEQRFDSAIELLGEIEQYANAEQLRSIVDGDCDTISRSICHEDTKHLAARSVRRRRPGRKLGWGKVPVALMAILALLAPRLRIWWDPPSEVFAMPAVSERHIMEDLPQLTPAMRLYLEDGLGVGSVAGIELRELGHALREGDLAGARNMLQQIQDDLTRRGDKKWLAFGGGAYRRSPRPS